MFLGHDFFLSLFLISFLSTEAGKTRNDKFFVRGTLEVVWIGIHRET